MDTPEFTLPSDKFDAWYEAEKAAFDILCKATGHVEGTNAFIGEFGSRVCNAFYFYNDPVQYSGEVFYAPAPNRFAIKYTAVGTFVSRKEAMRWAMKILCELPVRNVGNIELFRMDNTGIGALKADSIQFGNESAPRKVYVLPITFDLVLNVRADFTARE